MKTCLTCKKEYDDKLPFCLPCNGFVLAYVDIYPTILLLTYVKRP